ncbi:MAG: tRNA(Ile)-lysidine synthase [Candidatus Cloacimonetes bacterium ADurb.Bin211]|jgi:tRNA(Ile)-lysidine synthase|nr:MAG: tRNA(Ile)-lysidine synthase [Candidatus Cloacimonetes bacterium ADurb.Bin211]
MTKREQGIAKLRNYIREKNLFSAEAKLLLGVSGGSDSIALLYLFSLLRSEIDITLLAVHINHQLRGEESEADAVLVRDICQKLGVPLIVRKINLTDKSENQARQKRFEAFQQVLDAYQFDYIVTGHHSNDQTETMLLNLFRGAGLSGLAGLRPRSGKVLHPLLCFSKKELQDLLVEAQIPWREDSSNQELNYRRNWIRHKLLPLLEQEINPQISTSLGTQAEIFADAEDMILKRMKSLLKKVVLEQDNQKVILSLSALKHFSKLEQYYIIREVIAEISGSRRDFFAHNFENIINLYSAEGSKKVSLNNGIEAVKEYDKLIIKFSEESQPIPEPIVVEEDRSRVVWGDYRFSFKVLKVLPNCFSRDPLTVYIDADKIKYPFVIRSRKPGDRFIPFGMKQMVKLKDFLINCKVSKYERDYIPIFDDGEKIFWVTGKRLDQRVAIDDNSTRFLHITAEKIREKQLRPANRSRIGEKK